LPRCTGNTSLIRSYWVSVISIAEASLTDV
jgi:hypothetical protein